MAEKEKARISNEIQIFTNVFSKKKTLLIEKVLSLGLKNSMHQPAEKGDKKLLVKLKGTYIFEYIRTQLSNVLATSEFLVQIKLSSWPRLALDMGS